MKEKRKLFCEKREEVEDGTEVEIEALKPRSGDRSVEINWAKVNPLRGIARALTTNTKLARPQTGAHINNPGPRKHSRSEPGA
jgi:hypothetical protein